MVFNIKFKNTTYLCLINDINYDKIHGKVNNISFYTLNENSIIQLKTYIEVCRISFCGILKKDGNLHKIIRYINIECDIRHIPFNIYVDISLKDKYKYKISDILSTYQNKICKFEDVKKKYILFLKDSVK